ncbi:Transposase [Rhizobium sp. RU33A]|nr:Transposase [Rhizobium sp. RU33A]
MPKTSSSMPQNLTRMNPGAAAIDIGSTMHMAAVNPDCAEMPIRSFGTFTHDLHDLAAWFRSCGVTSVAMESTGVYWIPAYEILEQHGFEVILVNARYAKNVPGRKTDVSDAAWLRQLHSYGLLRGSFRPNAQVATLRAYLRQRERLVEYAAAHIQHMQKALMEMNLQLHHVVSDITGVTGMKIIRAIVSGERDPDVLASLRDVRCHSSVETIRASLIGNDRDEHVFALSQSLELYDFYQAKMLECDRKLEATIASMTVDPEAAPATTTGPDEDQTDECTVLRCASCTLRSHPDRFDPDSRPGLLACAKAHRRMRNGPEGMALRQALHIVALPRTRQQDLRRQSAVIPNPSLVQSSGSIVAVGCYHDRAKWHRPRRVLSTAGRAHR